MIIVNTLIAESRVIIIYNLKVPETCILSTHQQGATPLSV